MDRRSGHCLSLVSFRRLPFLKRITLAVLAVYYTLYSVLLFLVHDFCIRYGAIISCPVFSPARPFQQSRPSMSIVFPAEVA